MFCLEYKFFSSLYIQKKCGMCIFRLVNSTVNETALNSKFSRSKYIPKERVTVYFFKGTKIKVETKLNIRKPKAMYSFKVKSTK